MGFERGTWENHYTTVPAAVSICIASPHTIETLVEIFSTENAVERGNILLCNFGLGTVVFYLSCTDCCRAGFISMGVGEASSLRGYGIDTRTELNRM